jgi:uncharacterized Zn-binding protein involved in type VI secretion
MSIKGRRLAILGGAAAAAATLMVGSPTALAAPTTGVEFAVNCPGLGEFTVVTPPTDADFTPAFTVGTHQVAIPYRITGTVTVDGEVVEEFDDVKKAPVPADAITCTFEATFTEGDMTVTVAGTALVVQRGAP